MALALALKYRPTLFKDLIGQDAISQTLSLALDKNRITHAYLFSGLRGSGKTSSARILARALECENGPTSMPCGVCANCKSALEGRHLDIIEMDGASNRRIDDIRDLIEQTKYAPSMGRFKIFIIDEVHMLTKEAFNALLKTLEEPPEYVKFILATTDPLKLPATILSRTQHFRFKKIPHSSVIAHLKEILQKEGVAYEDEALEIITRSGAGSLRDTLTLTDQAINYCDRFLSTQKITQMLGVVDPKKLQDFFACIIHNDEEGLKNSLQILGEYECEMIIDEMLIFLKDMLFSQNKDYPLLLIDRFLGILTQTKFLLNLNPDGAFVLLLMSLKMREALKLKDIVTAIKELESKNLESSKASTKVNQDSKNSQVLDSEDSSSQDLSTPDSKDFNLQNPAPQTRQKFITLFEELKKRIYDRSLELGEAFSTSVEFEDFNDNVLSWRSNPNEANKEILKKYWSIIQELVQDVFAPNSSAIKIINVKPKANQDSTNAQNSTESKNTPESSLDSTQQNQNNQKSQTQIFIENNKELIEQIKQNFGATQMSVQDLDDK